METQTATVLDLATANARLLAKRKHLATTRGQPPTESTPPAVSALLPAASESLAPPSRRGACGDCGGRLAADDVDRWWARSRGAGAAICLRCESARRQAAWWQRAARIGDLLVASGVSLAHATATPADFAPTDSAWIDRLLDETHGGRARGLLVQGPVGTGKTRFAAAVVRCWLLAGQEARFLLAGQVLRRIWATYRDESSESEDRVIDSLCSVPLLVVDDLGREGRITDAVRRVFHEIISRRVDNYRPTVITTNLGPDDIGDAYDQAIRSRLSSLHQVVIRGTDRRLCPSREV